MYKTQKRDKIIYFLWQDPVGNAFVSEEAEPEESTDDASLLRFTQESGSRRITDKL